MRSLINMVGRLLKGASQKGPQTRINCLSNSGVISDWGWGPMTDNKDNLQPCNFGPGLVWPRVVSNGIGFFEGC